MTVRVECVVTAGRVDASAQDGEHEIETNVWIVGDDDEVVVIDAAYDASAILSAVGDREVLAVVCTHGLPAHVNAAIEVSERDEALVAVHPKDRMLWDAIYPDRVPDIEIEQGGILEVAGEQLDVLHTPGHTPGGVSLYAAGLETVFTGRTLGKSGPGSVEGAYGDFPTLLTAIGEQLLTLPGGTRVLPGGGEETTIEAQDANFDAWISQDPDQE